jgi:hypothetical protein
MAIVKMIYPTESFSRRGLLGRSVGATNELVNYE